MSCSCRTSVVPLVTSTPSSHTALLYPQVCNEIWEVSKDKSVRKWQGDIQSYKKHLRTLHERLANRKDVA